MMKQIKRLIGLAPLLAVVWATAQSPDAMRVKVPFQFVTAGKTWPAAVYIVQVRPDNGTLTLYSSGVGAVTMLTTSGDWSGAGRTYLQFQRSGETWVLQQVSFDGQVRAVPAGEFERDLTKERVSVEASATN